MMILLVLLDMCCCCSRCLDHDADADAVVTCLLQFATYMFSADVEKMVIEPIEKMVQLVQKISEDPLGQQVANVTEEEGFAAGMETTILLTTITKICALMRIGFGQAGATVIAKNLRDSTGGHLNLMGPGENITSIFGFCDVRNFTDTTECLQEEVMLFVNRIAHILHSIVVQCSGAANKNIGDAFLLTWKIEKTYNSAQISALADQALIAFLKSHIELSRHQNFIMNFTAAATARVVKRFKDYNVRIGTGLHVGWAIEGAIGTNRKIDATYLSPHVNMAEFLESSTKAYGAAVLMSEPFYRILSPTAKKYCRQVDNIRRSEAEEPMGLYTYDCDMNIDWVDFALFGSRTKKNLGGVKDKLRLAARRASTAVHEEAKDGEAKQAGAAAAAPPTASNESAATFAAHGSHSVKRQPNTDGDSSGPRPAASTEIAAPTIVVPPYVETVWETDSELIEFRHKVNDAFRALWQDGMAAYICGDWKKARDIFHETLKLSANDGPSKCLVHYIDEFGGAAPDGWHGYRMDGDGH